MIDAYQGLADVLFGAKHLLPAAKIYEQALERAPNRLPLLQNLAKARMMLKEAGREPSGWRGASCRSTTVGRRLVDAGLGAALHRGGDPAEALEAAEQAMRLRHRRTVCAGP